MCLSHSENNQHISSLYANMKTKYLSRTLSKNIMNDAIHMFLSSLSVARERLSKDAIYIQQYGLVSTTPVQAITQKIQDFLWTLRLHASQLYILSQAYNEYIRDVSLIHSHILDMGIEAQQRTDNRLVLMEDLEKSQIRLAHHSWINYLE